MGKIDELKGILQSIQNSVEMYNSINQGDKITITKQEQKDVSNMYICVYKNCENHVGLFKRKDWYIREEGYKGDYVVPDCGRLFVGVDSDYVGAMFYGARLGPYSHINIKQEVEGKSYVTNCHIIRYISFDEMRLIMYQDGQIEPYEMGKATTSEMLEVLKYARTYYGLDNKTQSPKR